jgi:hypothetical protein
MSETKWTPGPWRVRHGHPSKTIRYVDPVLRFDSLIRKGQNYEANARLIAAAPDLYEALDTALMLLDMYIEDGAWSEKIESMELVLAKARGEQ